MIRQMPFKLPLILSVVVAVFNNDEAQVFQRSSRCLHDCGGARAAPQWCVQSVTNSSLDADP